MDQEADRPMRRPDITVTTTAAGIAALVHYADCMAADAASAQWDAAYHRRTILEAISAIDGLTNTEPRGVEPVRPDVETWPHALRELLDASIAALRESHAAGSPASSPVLVRLSIGHGVPPGTYDVELPLDGSPATVELGGPLLSLHRFARPAPSGWPHDDI